MKEEDKWLETFREQLEDYTEPVPDGLWEELEEELDAAAPVILPWWRKWQTVAAAVLLVVGSSLLWMLEESPWVEEVARQSERLPQVPVVEEREVPSAPVASAVEVPSKRRVAQSLVRRTGNVPTMEADPMDVAGASKAQETDKEVRPSVPECAEDTASTKTYVPRAEVAPVYRTAKRAKRQKDSRWSFGLSAGNAPIGYSTGYGGYGRLYTPVSRAFLNSNLSNLRSEKKGVYEQILFNNMYSGDIESDVKHHTPITMGISLRREMGGKWALETGLTYTLLSSDLKSGNSTYYYKDEQRLHYVGIPLKVSREVWASSRWKVYASAGGAVEKCVDGKLTTTYMAGNQDGQKEQEDIEVDELQWSVSAAAGVQFNLNRRMGLYVEPGVSYYFDDGSLVETIRKEHPFNFNVQIGFRFTFAK